MADTPQPEHSGTPSSAIMSELERTCFVIMPFGEKEVAGSKVDFDKLFHELFRPAIESIALPENPEQTLLAKRTDMDAFSSSITQDMFEYIVYSRIAFADISGFNANVLYEIGARHAVQESGTVLFRQKGHPIPFDIASIKVFEYDAKPNASTDTAKSFISEVVCQTLRRNRLDSPVRLALRAQRVGHLAAQQPTAGRPQPQADPRPVDLFRAQQVRKFMRDAEEALRVRDLQLAYMNYWAAVSLDPLDTIARMRLGLTLKEEGEHYQALEEFTTITKLAPNYGEAWKEKGMIEGQIARIIPGEARPGWLADGLSSLQRATTLIPKDFDAWASLGGLLKNVRGDPAAALEHYRRATEVSKGHPYPLLNALKLKLQLSGMLDLSTCQRELATAEEMRRAQTEATPPTDIPWCFFDLAELRLYQQDEEGFLSYLRQGIDSCNVDWQPKTFCSSLQTLVDQQLDFPGLDAGIKLLEKAEKTLKTKKT